MQFSVLIAAVFATAVAASPLDLPIPPKRDSYSSSPAPTPTPTPYPTAYEACPSGLYSVPQCCGTDVLGLADLECSSTPAIPTSADEFRSICAASSLGARCCVVPVAGQAALCETPAGV